MHDSGSYSLKGSIDIIILMSTVFFQIGTNNGNDLFRELVIKNKPDCVILVEPNIGLLNEIRKNYSNIENVYIYSNAIYYNNDEMVELCIPAKNGMMGTNADNGLVYSDAHFSLVPMNDWGNKADMVKITSKGITFDKICSNHNITNIEYLQIDTEGFDSEIIKMIDLSKYKINKIRFEKWGFKPECFTEFNNKIAHELGINGMNIAIDKLKMHNYTLHEVQDNDGHDYIATLICNQLE
jgi:FkbM family methyltransferase